MAEVFLEESSLFEFAIFRKRKESSHKSQSQILKGKKESLKGSENIIFGQ
jgi:hypothetical protein